MWLWLLSPHVVDSVDVEVEEGGHEDDEIPSSWGHPDTTGGALLALETWNHGWSGNNVSVRLGHKWSYFYNHKYFFWFPLRITFTCHCHCHWCLSLVGNDIYKDSCMRMLIHLSVLFNLIHNIHTKAGSQALVTMEYAIRTMLQRLLQWCYIITGETKLACHQRSRALAVSFHTLLVTSCCRHPGHQDRESTNVTADLLQMSAAACRRWPQQTKDNNITLIRLANRYSITAWGTKYCY